MSNKYFIGFIALLIMAGCSTGAPAQSDALPTATIQPTPITPTMTPTQLPPPTVTSFPTATIQLETNTPTLEVTTDGTTAVATTPTVAPSATQPVTGGNSDNIPAGVNVGEQVLNAVFNSGWPSEDTDTAKYSIQNGQYVFEIGPLNARFLSTTAVSESDFYVQVETTPTNCPVDAGFGLLFRYQDTRNYYELTIFCNGSYRVSSLVDGLVGQTVVGSFSSSDPASAEKHTVGVAARGSEFTLYFDAKEIGTFSDDNLAEGDVGITSVSLGQGVLKVAFDNLQVWLLN